MYSSPEPMWLLVSYILPHALEGRLSSQEGQGDGWQLAGRCRLHGIPQPTPTNVLWGEVAPPRLTTER